MLDKTSTTVCFGSNVAYCWKWSTINEEANSAYSHWYYCCWTQPEWIALHTREMFLGLSFKGSRLIILLAHFQWKCGFSTWR